MSEVISNHNTGTAASLIRDLERHRGVPCAGCGEPLSFHQLLMAIALGFKGTPRCMPCLGAVLVCDPIAIRDSLLAYFRQRACYAEAWIWANRQAGLADGAIPPALRPLGDQGSEAPSAVTVDRSPPVGAVTVSWDAGDQGCGELVLELRIRLEKLEPGQVLQLTAHDLGAPEDLPAWCGLTGHALLRSAHPHYWIQRRG